MLHVRAVDDLNGACTIMDDWMMLVTTQLGLRHVRDFTDFDGFFSGIKECGNERLNGLTCRATQSVWVLTQHALLWTFGSAKASSLVHSILFICCELEQSFSRFEIVRNSIHGKEAATPLYRRACTGAYAFVVVGVACTKQMS